MVEHQFLTWLRTRFWWLTHHVLGSLPFFSGIYSSMTSPSQLLSHLGSPRTVRHDNQQLQGFHLTFVGSQGEVVEKLQVSP